MYKEIQRSKALSIYNEILAIHNDDVLAPFNTRFYKQEELLPLIRSELKKLGLTNRKVSVSVPNYVGARINVSLPHINYDGEDVDSETKVEEFYLRSEAVGRVKDILDRLFPENGGHYGEGGIYSDNYYFSYSVG